MKAKGNLNKQDLPVTKKTDQYNEDNILNELKQDLENFLGDSLVKLVLYGSKARGDSENDSDTDVAVIVKGLTRELKNEILDRVAEIEMKYAFHLSVIVFSKGNFDGLVKSHLLSHCEEQRDEAI